MKKIGILSDTHASVPERVWEFFEDVDEIWHAGDIGSFEVLDRLRSIAEVKAVYGNIDNHLIRSSVPEYQVFMCEDVQVAMIHIGGYPGRYTKEGKSLIRQYRPDLFVSGHSHILKVMYDRTHELLHINPGAAGNKGFHKLITAVKLRVDGKKMSDMEIFELERRQRSY